MRLFSNNILRKFNYGINNVKFPLSYYPDDPDYGMDRRKKPINYYYKYTYRYNFLPELSQTIPYHTYSPYVDAVFYELDYWDYQYYGQWFEMGPGGYNFTLYGLLLTGLLSAYLSDEYNQKIKDSAVATGDPFGGLDAFYPSGSVLRSLV